MPRITHYFPVSHDINNDPEVWELTDTFGDRALRVWLQMLSWSDRNEGLLKGSLISWRNTLLTIYSSGNPRWVRRDSERLQKALRWMSERDWISLRSASDRYQKPVREGSEDALMVLNYWKYHKRREPNKLPPTNQPTNQPTNHKEKIHKKEEAATPDGFAEFWLLYPKKVGKGAAEKSWRRIHPSLEIREVIKLAVVQQRLSPTWSKNNGEFIPNPATWLNQRRWEDEVVRSQSEDLGTYFARIKAEKRQKEQ